MKNCAFKKFMYLLAVPALCALTLVTGCKKGGEAAATELPVLTAAPEPTEAPAQEPVTIVIAAEPTATPVPLPEDATETETEKAGTAAEETVEEAVAKVAGASVAETAEETDGKTEAAPAAMTPLPYAEPSPLPSPEGDELELLRKFFRCLIESRDEDVPAALEAVREKNPERAAELDELLAYWKEAESDGFVNEGILPDGLPDDNSMCIVVFGYQLYSKGGMKAELVGRCEVALACAQKYPNAWILCTGGGTASASSATEAGKMSQWLRDKGVDKDRILIEDDSESTNENIKYCYTKLLSHPEITSVAVVTSDYHVIRCCLLFETRFLMKGSSLRVISNAAYKTDAESLIESRKMVADSVKRLYGVN